MLALENAGGAIAVNTDGPGGGWSLDLNVFTGLVQFVGTVRECRVRGLLTRIVVDAGGWEHRPQRGDSICISGCCLTLAEGPETTGGYFAFDMVAETLAKTTLGAVGEGGKVNLEHSVTASTLMGGHIVQGHIDGVGRVETVQTGDDWRIRIRPPAELMAYCVPKGSVSIDGVSLTLAEVDVAAGLIGVALIPETLAKTTLGELEPGDAVNIETDVLVKTVVHTMRHFLEHFPGGGGPLSGAVRSGGAMGER